MGVSLIALVVLGLFLLFGLGAVVIGILATGSRSRRAEDADMTSSSPSWFTGLFAGGGEPAGHPRHPPHHEPGHDSTPAGVDDAGAGGAGHDSGTDSGGFDGGGADAGGGSDGGGGSGGGD